MFSTVKNFVLSSKPAQLVVALLVGMAIGAIFYPTKHIEQRLDKTHLEQDLVLKQQYEKDLVTEHEQYTKLSQEYNSYKKETDVKVNSLVTQVTTLKSHQKTAYYKIVKPDGTIETRRFTDTDIDESNSVVTSVQKEFKEKVESIEKKWEQVHKDRVAALQKEYAAKEEEYKKTIDTLHQEKIVDINKKSFGIEAGGLVNGSYYGHVTYDVFGPFFIGAQGEWGNSNTAGAGLGIRF